MVPIWVLMIAVLAGVGPAQAQMNETQKRRALLPYIRAATDCIAREASRHPNVVEGYRTGNLSPMIAEGWRQCITLLTEVAVQHDALHGQGTGVPFVKGPYQADLPRAVAARIKSDMEARIASQEQADRQAREQASRREAERKAQAEQLGRAANTLRDRAYECTNRQLRSLVASAESAEVLATAAMTICRSQIDDAIEARLVAWRAESGTSEDPGARERLRGVVRQSVITSAVQEKANRSAQREPATVPAGNEQLSGSIAKLRECLTTIANAPKGQFVEHAKLHELMLDLCRPEIETVARDSFASSTGSDLAEERKKALMAASAAAKAIIGMKD